MADLFACAATLFDPNTPALDHPVTLRVSVNSADKGKIDFAFTDDEAPSNSRTTSFKLSAEAPFDGASFSYSTLDDTVTLEIDLNNDASAKQRFLETGIAGISFQADASLESVRIVLRPRPAGGDWSGQVPCFAILLCWSIEAHAATEIKATNGTITADASAAVEVCAGFSAIFPDIGEIGLPGFQIRLDLPNFGLTSAWVPLAWFEIGDLSPFRFNGLVRWFGDLVAIDWNELPHFPLPDWNVDLPLEASLPLGIGVRRTELHLLSPVAGQGLVVIAIADGFYLDWDGTQFDLGGRFSLTYVEQSAPRYTFEAILFEHQHPPAGQIASYEFSLPFDVLTLSADCWYLRLGLHASTANGKTRTCFELLLEIGGLTVFSSFSGSGTKGLYRSDLRLLVRDATVLVNPMAGQPSVPTFLQGATSMPGDAFARYKATPIAVPALSFARDLLAPPPADTAPTNDYGLEFLEGDFQPGQRVFILWRQNGMRFLRALAHDLLGRAPVGKVGADEPATVFGLEIAQFAAGETQLRLDWRPVGWKASSAQPETGAPAPIAGGTCVLVAQGMPTAVNLPLASHGVYLDATPADAMTISLPAIALDVARPRDQAIVVRREASGDTSVSHLMLFENTVAPGGPVTPIARACIGFSLKEDSEDAEHREVMETEDEAFLTVAVGYAGGTMTALRTIGWSSGRPARFLQTLRGDAPPVSTLLPAKDPSPTSGDPGCPPAATAPSLPVRLDFDAFDTPQFHNDAWRLSLKIAATNALFKLFGDDNDQNQSVKFEVKEICQTDDARALLIRTALSFRIGSGDSSFTAQGTVTFRFDIRDLALSVEDGAELAFKIPPAQPAGTVPGWATEVPLPGKPSDYWYSEDKALLGLEMTALATKQGPSEAPPEQVDVLVLSIRDGRFMLTLPKGRHLVVRYTKLGHDSLNFWVTRFAVGPGGVDLDADLLSSSLRVKGLARPFMLEKASLRICAGKLEYLSVDASGRLPELLNEAPVKLTIAFVQQAAGREIELDEMHCELGDKDSPIFSRGTRFKFEIDTLSIQYASDAPGGERHFFFELSGSAQFTPDPGEFGGGLLEDLKSAHIEFMRAPLSDEFHKSLKLVVELKRPVVFEIYKLFRMEIRSIGFEPNFEDFAEPGPAIIIGGQCEFAQFGDVISAEISFHAMRIGLPKRGDVMPQVHFNGLRVDISSPEGFRIAGRVDQYDTPTMKGFAGEGTVQIPGLPELSAAFAFVRLRKDETESWKHAWFIAIEAAKISYQIGPMPIYLRQIGLGFGYRYTLPLIKTFEEPTTLGELLKRMMAALDQHPTLARIAGWTADPTKGRALWTIVFEAVFSIATANPSPWDYRAKSEQKLKTLVAQFLAAFRSDFTLVSAAKIWYPVSVDDFFRDLEGMRKRPLASGFMIYSAPQSRFLAHATKGADPYMGPKNDPVPEIVKDILRNSHFEATLLIEPGLIHAELGWPDRLMFGWKIGSLELECRGGVLFRLERDILIQGTFFSGRGSMNLGGGVDFGFVGVRVEAHVSMQFATRMLTAVYLSKPLDSKIYAAQSLDIAVRFSVAAWLRLKIGFVKININISFSLHLQLLVALEIGWAGQGDLGFRGRARLVICVFGRSLPVQVAVSLNDGGVESARAALLPYMGSLLEPGMAPPMPGFAELGLGGTEAPPMSDMPLAELAPTIAVDLPKPGYRDELVSAHVQGRTLSDGDTLWFVWIMPGPNEHSHFYPPTQHPKCDPTDPDKYRRWIPYASLDLSQLGAQRGEIYSYQWDEQAKQIGWKQIGDKADLFIRPHAEISLSDEAGKSVQNADFFLDKLIAGCWRPKQPDDGEGKQRFFPDYWPAPAPELADVPPTVIGTILTDRRVVDRQDPARGPNRLFDPTDPIDAMLAAMPSAATALADTEAEQLHIRLVEQARGNQSFLLQALHDDLVRLAGTTTFTNNVPDSVPLSSDRPTLLDTGMILCVKSTDCPAWIRIHDRESCAYPMLTFVRAPRDTKPLLVRPFATFDMLDFARNPPVFRDAITYFDEDTIAIAFDLDWGGDPPTVARGAREDVEAYVRCYEITFFDVESQTVIKTVTSVPSIADVKGNDSLPNVDAVRARYRYTVARNEIVPASDLAAQRPRRIGVSVTPVSQTGQRGACFTDVLTLEPKLTPLPADDAQVTLTMPKSGAKPTAKLTWRQPIMPPTGGVARTEGWHLILRPLRTVPLGAYPEEATDVTDRGLMSTTGQALIAGDIVIRLYDPDVDANRATAAGYTRTRLIAQKPVDGQRAAEEEHKLDLNTGTIPGDVFNHRGEAQDKDSPVYAAARSFFTQVSAASPGGHAWRLFLRASSAAPDAKPDGQSGVSGLAPVRLLLALPPDETGKTPLRPLQHFEWPVSHQLAQVAAADIRAVAGPVRVAVVTGSGGLRFVQKPGRARAVTVTWNSLPSKPAAPLPAEAYAAYDVFEQPLDNLINADLDKHSGFAPDWRRLRRVVPTDAILASQVPATMADVQNWEAQYPGFARSIAFLQKQEVTPRDMTSEWPGWFSWAESELQWPPPAPFGDRIALPVSPKQAPELTPLEQLAVWRDLGRSICKMHLHEFLATLIGHVAETGGVGADARFAVQLIAGQPVAVKDPIKWLAANTATLDPYGWAALSHLGLGVTLTLRDPFTGLLLPQEKTLTAIRTALAEVSEMAGKAGSPIADEVNTLRKHMLVDLPIQHLKAYRSDDSAQALPDVALNMVQISVRPLPLPRAHYFVLTIEKLPTNDGEVVDVDITPATRLDLIFPRSERAAISVDPAKGERLSLRRAFRKEDEKKTSQILVREFPDGTRTPDFCDRLFQADVECRPTPVKFPLPLKNQSLDRALSPFQKFSAEPELWQSWLVWTPEPNVQNSPPTNYDLFLGYLEAAFKLSEDAQQTEQVDWHITLRRPEVERPLRESYMVWAARFFGTAPMGWATHEHDPLAEREDYMAIAQPKTVDPLKIAADGLGRLFLTHFVEEEWATSRRYAVMPVGRYERLWTSAEPPVNDPSAAETPPYRPPDIAGGGADIHLPRVRQLEPPKLLAARVVRSEDKRSFHEITVAHPERSLSQSNVPVRNKLSFGEVRRKYVRRFRHDTWKDRIAPALQGPEPGLPQPLPRTGAAVDTPHNLDRTADTLLAVAPQARWDSTRYLAAAEPYYYEQSVSILATASHDIQSEQKVVVLPSPEPRPIQPLGPPPVKVTSAAWSDEPTLAIYNAWRASTDTVRPMADAMLPDGFTLSIRLPRLVESLDPVSHDSYFAYELARYQRDSKDYAPVGYLPDPDVRITILDIDQGTATPIAQIAPRAVTPAAVADLAQIFELRPLSSDFTADKPTYAPLTDWADGIHATTVVRSAFQDRAPTVKTALLPTLAVPTLLTAVDPTQLLAPEHLPLSGPLLQLAPLALRLSLASNDANTKIQQLAPLSGKRWLCRPHLRLDDPYAQPMTQDDVVVGLRLIVEVERRRAAALLGFDVAAAQDDATRHGATGLLQRIEDSDIAILLRYQTVFEVSADTLAAWQMAGVMVWHRQVAPAGATWSQVIQPQTSNNDWNLVTIRIARAENDPDQDAINQVVDGAIARLNQAFLPLDRQIDRVKSEALLIMLRELAAATFRSAGMRKPVVFVQRGNEPRVEWPRQ